MSDHSEIRELLTLAAAGELSAEEQRRIESHVAGCPECAAELDEWRLIAEAITTAPAPVPPAGLVDRTRNRVAAAAAARRERVVGDVVLGFLLLFGWTVSLAVWFIWRLMSGGPLLEASLASVGLWLGGSTLFAWLTAGVAVVMIAPKREAMRRMS
jgi:anti-sigma factor RsiW